MQAFLAPVIHRVGIPTAVTAVTSSLVLPTTTTVVCPVLITLAAVRGLAFVCTSHNVQTVALKDSDHSLQSASEWYHQWAKTLSKSLTKAERREQEQILAWLLEREDQRDRQADIERGQRTQNSGIQQSSGSDSGDSATSQ